MIYYVKISFKGLQNLVIGHRVIKWDETDLELENGLIIIIEYTEQDC